MSEEDNKEDNKINRKAKKSIWEKWWVWLIVIILAIAILGVNPKNQPESEQNNEEKQLTQPQKENERNMVEEVECRDGLCGEVWKIEEVNSKKDYIKELENFVAAPSLTRLEEICQKAKDIKTAKTKEVLSNDRTEMVRERLSLWEVLPVCKKVKDKSFIFKEKEEGKGTILAEFKESDTDEIRKSKIEFNEKIEGLLKNQKIFGYNSEAAKFIDCFLEHSCGGEGVREGSSDFGKFISPYFDGIALPIKEIKGFLEEYKRVENK